MKDRETNLAERVAQAARALVRGEDANWELARLTCESTYNGRRGIAGSDPRVSIDEWAEAIRAASGRNFAASTAKIYKRVWERFGGHYSDHQMSWSDAYYEIRGTTLEESFAPFANQDARKVAANVERLKPEVKRELVERLIEDPEVEERLERQFVQKAATDTRLAGRVNAAWKEFHLTPEPSKEVERREDAERRDFLYVGHSLYSAAWDHKERVDAYAAYLSEHRPIDEYMATMLRSVLDRIGETGQLLRGYEDQLSRAAGHDPDETARRILQGIERGDDR